MGHGLHGETNFWQMTLEVAIKIRGFYDGKRRKDIKGLRGKDGKVPRFLGVFLECLG